MAENTLPETDDWVDGIYQLETDDKVLGGADGVSNRQARELAGRTRFLKAALAALGSALSTHATSRDHPSATTKLRGLTRLATLDEHAEDRDDVAATPAGVLAGIAAAFSRVKTQQATSDAAGISREATTAEAVSGKSTTPDALPHVTPEGVAAALENALEPVAASISAVADRATSLESRLAFVVLYPGGSAAAPAVLSNNTRKTIANPFGDAPCLVSAEIERNGVWGATGYYNDQTVNSDGTQASVIGGQIVIQSGSRSVCSASTVTGNGFGIGSSVTSAPYRVKVWKLAGE